MANRPAPALVLREGDRERLSRLSRSSSVRAGLAQRARIVLLAADGVSNTAIAQRVGVSRPTVIGWRDRYLAPAANDRSRRDRGRDVEPAAEEAGGDALVDPTVGQASGHFGCDGGQGVA